MDSFLNRSRAFRFVLIWWQNSVRKWCPAVKWALNSVFIIPPVDILESLQDLNFIYANFKFSKSKSSWILLKLPIEKQLFDCISTPIFKAVYFLKLCPIFVSTLDTFDKKYEKKLKAHFWSVDKVVLRFECLNWD